MLLLLRPTRPARGAAGVVAMSSTLMLTALEVAAKAQAEVLVLFGAGAFASATDLLPPTLLPAASKLQLLLLQPCLLLTLNQSFTVARLLAWSPVLALAAVHIGLGAILGLAAGRLLRLRTPRRELLILTSAFGNVGALPFVLVLPIVRQWPVTRDDPQAHETGLAVIGMYLITWFLMFFTVGVAYCRRIGQPSGARRPASAGQPLRRSPLAIADEADEARVRGVRV